MSGKLPNVLSTMISWFTPLRQRTFQFKILEDDVAEN
jgi:hypothetical protein